MFCYCDNVILYLRVKHRKATLDIHLLWISSTMHQQFTSKWIEQGRAIAQVVSRWFPAAAAWVRARVWSCGICGGQSGAGAGFLRVLRLPLPIFVPPIAPQSPSSIIWGLYNRPEVAAVPSGLSPTPQKKRVYWTRLLRSLDRNRLNCYVIRANCVPCLT
jgi:hypothetical protein